MNEAVADVVVIGSGAAGMLAALRAAHLGMDCILTSPLGKPEGSASWFAGADFTLLCDQFADGPEQLAEDLNAEGMFVGDPKHIQWYTQCCDRVESELYSLGLSFRRKTCEHGSHIPRAGFLFGWEWCRAIAAAVAACPRIRVFGGAKLESLLGDRSSCEGAEFLVGGKEGWRIYTQHTVLATGGWGGLFARKTASPFATGGGIGAAARLGARLLDMEFVQFVPFVPTGESTFTNSLALHFLTTAYRLTRLCTTDGRTPLADQCVIQGEGASKEVIQIALALDLLSHGETRYLVRPAENYADRRDEADRSIRAMLRRLPTLTWNGRHRLLEILRIFDDGGAVEVEFGAHFTCGGVEVGMGMEASVPGLYAVGECRAGLWGAGRVHSACTQCHTDAMALTFGSPGSKPSGCYNSECLSLVGRNLPRSEVRRAVNEALGYVRSPQTIQILENRLYEWLRIANVSERNELTVLLAACVAAKSRRESRGCHIRIDEIQANELPESIVVQFEQAANIPIITRIQSRPPGTITLGLEQQLRLLQCPEKVRREVVQASWRLGV